MKKENCFFIVGIVLIFILFIVFVYKNNEIEVVFVVDNEIYKTIKARKNTSIKESVIPQKDNQIFIGWYTDDGKTLDEDTIVSQDIVYYARWGIISNEE